MVWLLWLTALAILLLTLFAAYAGRLREIVTEWMNELSGRNVLIEIGEIERQLSDFIQHEVRLSQKRYSHENLTIAFLRLVIAQSNPYRPTEGEYLSTWNRRRGIPPTIVAIRDLAYSQIKERLAELQQEANRIAHEEAVNKALGILKRNENKVEKFLDIAYRKVATPDEYGDENPTALDKEIQRFITKLGETETDLAVTANFLVEKYGRDRDASWWWDEVAVAVANELTRRFGIYYTQRRTKNDGANVASMTGVEFELHIAEMLRTAGIENVSTTAKTGDQGADLLFTYNSLKYVLQAKRYGSSVGNKAIQEAHAARGYYHCDRALVVTNSRFTASARTLAKELRVLLVDGDSLVDLGEIIRREN